MNVKVGNIMVLSYCVFPNIICTLSTIYFQSNCDLMIISIKI